MTASQIFLYLCLAFIVGIFLNSILYLSQPLMLGILILGILLISVFWEYKKLVVIGFCLLILMGGAWRHRGAELRIIFPEERDITFVGIIIGEPDIRANNIKLILKSEEVKGKVSVTTNRYPEYQYGDKLKISGKLQTPPAPEGREGFNYRNYLAKDGIFAVIYWPEIELAGRGFGNPIMSSLFTFKNRFQETCQKFISPPQIGILEALFSGDERGLSKEWKDKLNITGTRHIAAVSGMNITIIAFLIMSFAASLGLWKRWSILLSISLVALYVLMIGAPASAVRAGIMAVILMTAQYLGRLSSAARGVLFAATLMLAFNPLLLRLDIGFQLSFLAILGLIYFQPIFFHWLRPVPDPKIFPVRTTLSAAFAAQIFTLPILVYNFGYITLLSPVTNLLIVPFLAPITILIFIFGISGMLIPLLGYLFSLPTWLSLTYITLIINCFSRLSGAVLFLENVHWAWLIAAYLVLGYVAWRLSRKQKLRFLEY